MCSAYHSLFFSLYSSVYECGSCDDISFVTSHCNFITIYSPAHRSVIPSAVHFTYLQSNGITFYLCRTKTTLETERKKEINSKLVTLCYCRVMSIFAARSQWNLINSQINRIDWTHTHNSKSTFTRFQFVLCETISLCFANFHSSRSHIHSWTEWKIVIIYRQRQGKCGSWNVQLFHITWNEKYCNWFENWWT